MVIARVGEVGGWHVIVTWGVESEARVVRVCGVRGGEERGREEGAGGPGG